MSHPFRICLLLVGGDDLCYIWGDKGGIFKSSDITSEGLGEMFEGDSAHTLTGKFPLVSMGGRAEGLACADPVARTPIGASGNIYCSHFMQTKKSVMTIIVY